MTANLFAWLNAQSWFGALANIIQITSSPALIVGFVMWRKRRCRVPYCLRIGAHPVEGTTWKVCPNHHKPEYHHSLKKIHAFRHPERLGHGEMP